MSLSRTCDSLLPAQANYSQDCPSRSRIMGAISSPFLRTWTRYKPSSTGFFLLNHSPQTNHLTMTNSVGIPAYGCLVLCRLNDGNHERKYQSIFTRNSSTSVAGIMDDRGNMGCTRSCHVVLHGLFAQSRGGGRSRYGAPLHVRISDCNRGSFQPCHDWNRTSMDMEDSCCLYGIWHRDGVRRNDHGSQPTSPLLA